MLSSSHLRHLFAVAFSLGVVASNPALAQVNTSGKVGLEGFCPVCLVEARKWEMGSRSISSVYDGVTYHFPNDSIKSKFDASPAKYVPALGGDCIVCYEKMKKRVAGNIRFASVHRDRVYLFPGEGERKMFHDNPEMFAKTDIAANGECVVCLAKASKHVPGSEKFTEIHGGFRYLFPSTAEQTEFRRNPKMYTGTSMLMPPPPTLTQPTTLIQPTMMINEGECHGTVTNRQPIVAKTNIVTVSGRSGCAACEHGVKPLMSPNELGLAVKTNDGRVVVVENAHRLYPNIYAARFEGRPLQVKGEIVKTQGHVSWLKPSAVQLSR